MFILEYESFVSRSVRNKNKIRLRYRRIMFLFKSLR